VVGTRPFSPSYRLASRPGAEIQALADLVDGDQGDLESILFVLSSTDVLARNASGALAALPPADEYRGDGAAAVMLPFLLPSPSRFSEGSFGVLYGADSIATSIDEVSYHHSRRLVAAGAPTGTSVLLALWEFTSSYEVVDLRGHRDRGIYDPASYAVSQPLGKALRKTGAPGVLYESVRRMDGACVGVFIPRCIDRMSRGGDWRLIWDGAAISEVLRVA